MVEGTKLNFEVTKEPFNTGRYIEVATFADGNTIMNMHNILASISQPMVFNWNKLKWEVFAIQCFDT